MKKAKATWVKVCVRSFFHRLQCTPHISGAGKLEYSQCSKHASNFYSSYCNSWNQLLRSVYRIVTNQCFHITLEIKNQGMIGQVTEQASVRDHHDRSNVDQMWHLGSYEHFGSSEQGLNRVETTMSVATMQNSVRLPKAVAIFAAERARSYVWLNETVTGKVWWGDFL